MPQSDETPGFSSAEVVEHFRRETGETLVIRRALPELQELAVFDVLRLAPTNAVAAGVKYGEFQIRVFDDVEEAKRLGLIEEGQRDDRGRLWRHSPSEFNESGRWYVTTLYGNVMLSWWSGEEPRVDDRWETLDRTLSDLHRVK